MKPHPDSLLDSGSGRVMLLRSELHAWEGILAMCNHPHQGGAGSYPRTEVLVWWQHVKVLVVTLRLLWVILSPGQVPGLESLGARGEHQRGGPGAASPPDVLPCGCSSL